MSSWEPGGSKWSVCALQETGVSIRDLKKMKKKKALFYEEIINFHKEISRGDQFPKDRQLTIFWHCSKLKDDTYNCYFCWC